MYTVFIYAYNRVFLIMAVTGELAGQPVTLNNAAEEATLQAINNNLRQLGQAAGYNLTGLRQADRAAIAAGTSLGSVARAAGQSANNLDANANAIERFTRQARRNLGNASLSIGRALGSSTENFGDRVTALGAGLSKITEGLSIPGALFGTTIGVVAGQISGLVKSFDQAQRSGGSFGYSMEAFSNIALRSGLTFGQMADVANKAGEALSQFGGTTTQGSQNFIRFNNQLRNSDYGKDLMRLGMSVTDQAIAMADYTGQLARFGMNIGELDTRDTVRDMALYQKELKALSQITGNTLDQQRALQKKEMQDANSRAAIMTLQKDQQMIALNAITAATEKFGPQAGKVIQELIAHGDVVSKESLMFAEQNSAAFGYMKNLTTDLKAGAANADGVTQMFKDMEGDSRIGADLQRNAQLAAQMIGVAHSNAYIETIKSSLAPIADTVGQFRNAGVEKILEDQNRLSESYGSLTAVTIQARDALQKTFVGISTATAALGQSETAQKVANDFEKFGKTVSDAAAAFSTSLLETRGDYQKAMNALRDAVGMKKATPESTAAGDWFVRFFRDGKQKPEIPEYAFGTMGKTGNLFQNFGSETLAKLHGMEAVTTPEQMAGIVEKSAQGGMNAFAKVFNRLRIGQDNQPDGPDVAAMFENMTNTISQKDNVDNLRTSMDTMRSEMKSLSESSKTIGEPFKDILKQNMDGMRSQMENLTQDAKTFGQPFVDMFKQNIDGMRTEMRESNQNASTTEGIANIRSQLDSFKNTDNIAQTMQRETRAKPDNPLASMFSSFTKMTSQMSNPGREIKQPGFNMDALKEGLNDTQTTFKEMSKQILETVNNNTSQSKQPVVQQAPMATVAAPKNLDQEMLSALQHSNDVLMRIYRELEDGHRRLERAYT